MSKAPAMVLFLAFVIVASAHAQTPSGTIDGVVTDLNGAPIAGARITLTNSNSGLIRKLRASAEGHYSALALPAGVYHVTAEASGFQLGECLRIVEAGTTTTVNLILKVGELSEAVNVSDVAPLINYEQNQLGGVISRKQIENLPLNGRNFLDL